MNLLALEAEMAEQSNRQKRQARTLAEFVRPVFSGDPGELLRQRFLCRGGGLLLVGPTGIGKSSLSIQFALCWGIGRDCFGIVPARSLTSLIVQAENDDGDIAEMRDGVVAGLNFSTEDRDRSLNSVRAVQVNDKTSTRFLEEEVRPLLSTYRPDLLWIDPALSYIGGEANSQRDVGRFLRNELNPLLQEFGCGAVILHHTNKPPNGREKAEWVGGDFAYLGGGSAEWANWARAILALRAVGSDAVYELRAAKRGARLDWRVEGERVYQRCIKHAAEPGVICWREVSPEEIARTGRPRTHDANDLLSLLSEEGISTKDWEAMALQECGISRTSFFRFRKELQMQKMISKDMATQRWKTCRKPSTVSKVP